MLNLFPTDRHHLKLLTRAIALRMLVLLLVLLGLAIYKRNIPWFLIHPSAHSPAPAGIQGQPSKIRVTDSQGNAAGSLADITFDGNQLWVTGNITGTHRDPQGVVFPVDPSTGATGQEIAVGKDPQGVLFDGRNLWIANRGDGSITCIEAPVDAMVVHAGAPISTTFFLTGTHPSPRPIDLTYDGQYVWVADSGANSLWRLPASGCTPPGEDSDPDIQITTVEINGKEHLFDKPFGILYDGAYLWVANQGNKIFRLQPDLCESREDKNDQYICKKASAIQVESSNSQPMNLAYDGSYILVTRRGLDQVTRIHPRSARLLDTFEAGIPGDTDRSVSIPHSTYDGLFTWTIGCAPNGPTPCNDAEPGFLTRQ